MKKTIAVIVIAIIGVCIFTGCIGIAGTMILGGIQSHPKEGYVHKEYLAEKLTHPKNQLLTESEKLKAAKNICALKHLDTNKNSSLLRDEAKAFCSLKKNDKIYFHDLCIECGRGTLPTTGYLLIRDDEPFRFIDIEAKGNKVLHRPVPIVDRLH